MRIWLVLALLAACKGPAPEWKQRTGPGFTVEAPFDGKLAHQPLPGSAGSMQVYIYVNEPEWSLQVQILELPKTAIPMQVIVEMRDRAAAQGKILQEKDVAMGDVPGKDLTFIASVPDLGQAGIRDRILIQAHTLYQVMFVQRTGTTAHGADGDRFIESFKLTGTPLDVQTAYRDFAGSNAPAVDFKQAGAGSPDADGWYTAHSVAGRFTVRLPGPYNEAHSDLGDDGVLNIVATLKMPERIKLVAGCVDGSKTAKPFEDFASGADSHRELQIQGHRAIEVRRRNTAGLEVEREGGLCVLSVEPYSKTTPLSEPDARKMFDSFKLD
jgi:hypothetical protein